MRKFFYILLGCLLIAGAVGTFGVRQFGLGRGGYDHSSFDKTSRSMEGGGSSRGAEWHGGGDRDGGGGRRGRSLFSVATVLDVLNVVVGVIGIVLTIGGLRMQRAAMQMNMRSRD